MKIDYRHDTRKEPKKLQKERTKEEGVSDHPSYVCKGTIHSLRKTSTTCCPPLSLITEYALLLQPLETREPVSACVLTAELASTSLKGRVFEISLADLNQNSNDHAFRKIKLQTEEVKGSDCYTNFYGMDITRDKLCQLVKKWHTTIEAFVDVKTLDGYFLRLFCLGFTEKRQNQIKATCYAKQSQIKQIRKIMMNNMVKEVQKSTLRELTLKL